MPNLPLIEDNADPRIAAVYEDAEGGRAGFPNLYRLIGNSPEMLKAWTGLMALAQRRATPARIARTDDPARRR